MDGGDVGGKGEEEEEGVGKGEAVQIKKRRLEGLWRKRTTKFVRIKIRRRRPEERLLAHVICHRKTSGWPNDGRTRIGWDFDGATTLLQFPPPPWSFDSCPTVQSRLLPADFLNYGVAEA